MVHFSLNIKAWCLYAIREKQDQIWAKIFCIPKNMHSRTPMITWSRCDSWSADERRWISKARQPKRIKKT